MVKPDKNYIKGFDERNRVEKPLLDQFIGKV